MARVVDTRYSLITDRAVVIRDLTGDKYPELQLFQDGPSIIMHGHLTVNQIKQKLQAKGLGTNDIEFFAPDGSLYAGCSQIKDIL